MLRLITVMSTILTNYDLRLLRFLPVLVVLLNLGLAVLLLNGHRRLMPVAFFLFAVVLFTLYHDRSWLDWYFSQWQQALFFLLLGLLILQRMQPGWLAFTLLVICAIAASLEFGGGLPAWICLPIAALGIPAYRQPRYAILWFAAGALFLGSYFSEYARTPYQDKYNLPSLLPLYDIQGVTLYLFRFQSARFNTDVTNVTAMWFIFICLLMLAINLGR